MVMQARPLSQPAVCGPAGRRPRGRFVRQRRRKGWLRRLGRLRRFGWRRLRQLLTTALVVISRNARGTPEPTRATRARLGFNAVLEPRATRFQKLVARFLLQVR